MKKALLLLGFIGFFQNAYSFSFGSSSFLKTRAIAITTACASLKTSGISLFKAAKTIAFEYPKTTALCLAAVATGYAVYKYFKPKSTTTATTTQPATTSQQPLLRYSPEGLSHFEKKLTEQTQIGKSKAQSTTNAPRKVPATTQPATTRTQQLASEGATEETERPSASASQASEGASSGASDSASDGAGAAKIEKIIATMLSPDLIEYNFADDAMYYNETTGKNLFKEAIITIFNKNTNEKEFYLFSGTEQTKLIPYSDETPQSNCERAAEIRRLFLSNRPQNAIKLLYSLQYLEYAKLITEAEAIEKQKTFAQRIAQAVIENLPILSQALDAIQRKPSASIPKASEGANSGASAASATPTLSTQEKERLAMTLALAKVLSTNPTAQAAFAAYTASQPDKAGAAGAATA